MEENHLVPTGGSSVVPAAMDQVDDLLRSRLGDATDSFPERARLEDELQRVRRQLDSQINATRIARETASNAIGQLKSVEFDTQRTRLELDRTRTQLTQVQQFHEETVRHAEARERTIRNDLDVARQEVVQSQKVVGNKKKFVVLPMVVAGFALCWAAIVQWKVLDSEGGLRNRDNGPAPSESTIRPAAPQVTSVSSTLRPSSTLSTGGAADLTDSLARLDRAMDRFGSSDPESVLRLVHTQNLARGLSVCSFAWNGGQVSLVFGGKEDPSTAITHCADAVESAASSK